MQFLKVNVGLFLGIICSFSALSQGVQFINKVYEYMPAPGQFINTPFGFPEASKSIIGAKQGGVSLGAFGGYIIVGFEKPIKNEPDNPYGIDFTIFGNANQSSSEPAVVYVMKDENGNNLPDDTWYVLAGSDYWFKSTFLNYEITYFNLGGNLAKDIIWQDNQGITGSIPLNEFHTQTYYPFIDSFPNIPSDSYILRGEKIKDRLDYSMQDYITTNPTPFGYADNLPINNNYSGWEPDNPYTKAVEGTGGDGFDIDWAVDEEGNYLELNQIDFIKIQTGVNALAGWLGELSSEVLGVVDVEPNKTLSGQDKLLVIEPVKTSLYTDENLELTAFPFIKGRLQKNESIIWKSGNNKIASVNEFGVIKALNEGFCYVYAVWESEHEISDSIKIKVYSQNAVSISEELEFSIYPNPVNDILFLSNNHKFTQYTLFDCSGKKLIQSNISDNSIVLETLAKGFYYIDFMGDGIYACKKIIKN